MPGSLVRKSAVQLDWEFDARTFGYASLSQQTIANAMYSDGSILYMPNVLIGDRVESLGPLIQTAETAVDAYNSAHPRSTKAGCGRRVWRSTASSRHAGACWRATPGRRPATRATGCLAMRCRAFRATRAGAGQRVAAQRARLHLWLAGVPQRALHHRAQQPQRAPGWNLALAHSMDFGERRWSLIGSVQTPLVERSNPRCGCECATKNWFLSVFGL